MKVSNDILKEGKQGPWPLHKCYRLFLLFRVIPKRNVNLLTSNVVLQDVPKVSNDEIKTIMKKIVSTKKTIVNIVTEFSKFQ